MGEFMAMLIVVACICIPIAIVVACVAISVIVAVGALIPTSIVLGIGFISKRALHTYTNIHRRTIDE